MAGIHVGDVGGNVELIAGGDIVGGDKIVHITTTIQISAQAVVTRPLIAASPYRGLHRFDDRDREVFFGRDQLIERVLTRLGASSLLMVLGASGSGKSSLVRAGVLPALGHRIGRRLRYFVLVPDADPFESLRSALMAGGFSQADTGPLLGGRGADVLGVIRSLQPPGELWLFFVDQFEETFTRTAESLRTQFISALLAIAREPAGAAKVVLAMRADFLERLSPFPDFAKCLEHNLQLVTDMHADELRQAIEQPAARHGVVFESGLVEDIIKEVQGQAGPLPLLQYTLNLMWEDESKGGLHHRTLRARTYRALGGVRGALEQRAEAMYAALDGRREPPAAQSQHDIVRQIFLRLVDVAVVEGTDDASWRPVRRRVPMGRFGSAQQQAALAILIDHKLLVSDLAPASGADGGGQGEATVEVAHEALFSSWSRLRTWIGAARRGIFVKNRLADDARRWSRIVAESATGGDDELWTGSRLDEALELRARHDFATVVGALDADEVRFLDESAGLRDKRRRAVETQRRRIRRGLAGGFALVLAFSGFAVYQWRAAVNQTDRATARQLAQDAEFTFRNDGPDALYTSTLLAIASLKRSWTVEAQKMLADRLQLLPPPPTRSWPAHTGTIRALAVNSDDRWLASTDNVEIAIWDLQTGAEIRRMKTERQMAQPVAMAFSPDGRWFAASSDPTVWVWNTADWSAPPRVLPADHRIGGSSVFAIDFSADGTQLVVMGSGPRLFEVGGTWARISAAWSKNIGQGVLSGAAFSPHGGLLATSSGTQIQLWSSRALLDGSPERDLEAPLGAWSVGFDGTGEWLVAVGPGGVAMWNVPEGGPPSAGPTFNVRLSPSFTSVEVSRDRRFITVAPTVHVWELGAEPREAMRFPDRPQAARFTHNDDLVSAAEGQISLRSADAGHGEIARLERVSAARAVTFSGDGTRLAIAGDDGVAVFDAAAPNWRAPARVVPVTGGAANVALTADGRLAAVRKGSHVLLLDLDRDREPPLLLDRDEGDGNDVYAVIFSPDGRTLAVPAGNSVELLRTSPPYGHVALQHEAKVTRVGFSPDGEWLATLTKMSCRPHEGVSRPSVTHVWRASTAKEVAAESHEAEDREYCMQTLHEPAREGLWGRIGDPRLLAAAARWRMSEQEPPRPSGDGRWELRSSSDGSTVVEVASGRIVRSFAGFQVRSVAFSPDSRWLVTAGDDGVARVWALTVDDLIADACTRVARNLTPDEWSAHLGDAPYAATCTELATP